MTQRLTESRGMRFASGTLRGCCLVGMLLLAAGCNRVHPTPGGTVGSLKLSGVPMSDLQVTVYAVSGTSPTRLGFGTTDQEGEFELYTEGAKGPLFLESGTYVFTVESAGAPVEIPPVYAQPGTSPLKVVWNSESESLDLEVQATGGS
jgi:hypothetical protein